ncbi:MAG: glycoside hydrolase family 16 protein [Flavobacteriales bacterium]|nr:glycoside hydrolase family 16 protein [Flavobacteriales bacterium]
MLPPRVLPLLLLLALTDGELLAQTKREKRVGPKEYSAGGSCDTSAWKLVFQDEFNGTTLDRTKWVTYFTYSADGSDQCPGCRVMGTSNTIFRDDLVQLRDGMLHLGVQTRAEEWYGQRKDHAGSMVHSIGDAHFNHGRFEVRCRIPKGAGLWPAFWGFGGETEIDVFEFCGEKPNWMKGSLHRWGKRKFSHTGKHKATDLSRDFHVYAVEWDGDETRWYLDDRLVHRRARYVDKRGRPLPVCDRAPGELATAPYFPKATDGINLVLDLAVSEPGGYCNAPKVPVQWPTDTRFEVDYVRVYQRMPEPHLRDRCAQQRQLLPSDANAAPPRYGETRTYTLTGPEVAVEWSTSAGLEIVERTASTVTIRVGKRPKGAQWLQANIASEPCSAGVLAPRISVAIRP